LFNDKLLGCEKERKRGCGMWKMDEEEEMKNCLENCFNSSAVVVM
jgi:hypothetical protein